MLAVMPSTLQAADAVLLSVGGVALLGWIVGVARSGRWRQPLGGVHASGQGPGLLDFVLIIGVMYVASAAAAAVSLQTGGAAVPPPGSHAWHVRYAIDGVAKSAACAVAILLLALRRSFAPTAETDSTDVVGLGGPRMERMLCSAGIAVLAACACHALTSVQKFTAEALWRRFEPGVVPPVHEVLLSLHESAWGWLGRAQLYYRAVIEAPLVEEVLFRGIVLQMVWRYTRHAWLAVSVSAVAFGFMHVTQPQDVVPLVSMGIVLGYFRLRRRSLTLCVAIHALFNLRTMVFATLAPELIAPAAGEGA
ncbi:MAG: hypothetical protein CHACPFDD_04150 [Phycisphaerae bacterium]|nr:hypothetical protein [Phycisphaerae bacterium]